MHYSLPYPIRTIADVEALGGTAERLETPCGSGMMVWRKWGNTGDPVIMCHGGSGSWTHWCRTIPVLAQHHTLYVADLPGLGESAMPVDAKHPAGAAEALAQGIRLLVPKERRPRVVAFSFGAHLGALAVAGLADYVRDITLIGTAALGTHRPPMDFPKETPDMADEERRKVHRAVLEMLMFTNPDRIDDLAIELQARNVRQARFRSRIHAPTDNVKRALARIKQPVQTIWGRNDAIALPDLDTVLTIIGEHHPELRTTIIPDAGHWVMFEQPDAFNEALIEMLA